MRTGIGAVLGSTGGPRRYAQGLVSALDPLGEPGEYTVFTNRPEAFAGGRTPVVHVPLPSPLLEPVWDHVLLPAALRRRGIDVYHGVKAALPLRLRCKQVVTIHDLAVYACPQTFALLQHAHMRPHIRLAVRRADRIVADSEHARGDIVRRFALRPERVVPIPLGVNVSFSDVVGADDESRARRLELPPRFVVYAGTIQPRKNIDLVVRAFEALGAAPEWMLVIVGRLRPGYRPSWLRHPPSGVRYLGPVSDADLAMIYRRAAVLASPSSYEGFGLTLLEAMASGCPVLAAARTAVPEVVGDAGLLLDAIDEESLGQALRRLLGDAELRRDLSRRGIERARAFSWAETARRTRALYEEVCRENG